MLFKHCRTVNELQALRAIRAVKFLESVSMAQAKGVLFMPNASKLIDEPCVYPLDNERSKVAGSAQIWALDKTINQLTPSGEFLEKLLSEKPSVARRIKNNYRLHGILVDSASDSAKSITSINPVKNFTKTTFFKDAKDRLEYFHSQKHE